MTGATREEYPNAEVVAWDTPAIDQFAVTAPQDSEWTREIRMDQRDRVAASIVPDLDNKVYRIAIIAAASLVGLGVFGWIAVSSSGLAKSPVSLTPPQLTSVKQVNPSASASIADKAEKPEVKRSPISSIPAAAARADETSKSRTHAVAAVPMKHNARPPEPTAVERTKVATRPVPVPETRPTTIEGWTVREVNNGTVTLQGPNGTWKATRGSAVPGVGNIHSIVRWGDRWIVATSRGLISTR